MSDKKVTVYALIDPRTDKVFYVGTSHQPAKRIRDHLFGRSNNAGVRKIVVELKDCGLRFKVRFLESIPAEQRLKREKFWILKYYNDGEPLVNESGLRYKDNVYYLSPRSQRKAARLNFHEQEQP